MNLIYKNIVNNLEIKYYEGIDFDIVKEHPKDGSNGMLIFFINNWVSEVNKWKRNSLINELLDEKKSDNWDLSNIDNNFISIYQSEGIPIDVLFETIKGKIERDQFINQTWTPMSPWTPITSIDKGAWKINTKKSDIIN
jgi:hypothetical protein